MLHISYGFIENMVTVYNASIKIPSCAYVYVCVSVISTILLNTWYTHLFLYNIVTHQKQK